ncbi:tRNA splicing endonuclease subunit sen2 [Sporothrix stenoceras]|uniref:tRNA-intron lyase n=1 Tax=Sporothrix stenoceras TaxID=5173 RepID=A0ABR3Z0R6_9PEZI
MAETKEPPLSGPASSSSSSNGAAAPLKASTDSVKQPPSSSTPTNAVRAPRQKYRMPLPLRTFPLPTFYPSNPVSLVHLAFAWVRQVLLPPASEPSVVHTGVWSAATRSVHVTDSKSINDLWSQGFYGKGSLSRSEPNWLNREKARAAAALVDAASAAAAGGFAVTSEQRTNKRREERADTKWERGRTELEAIEQRRREEEAAEAALADAAAAAKAKAKDVKEEEDKCHVGRASLPSPPPSPTAFKAPVGPLELLALPNSEADLRAPKAAAAAVEPTLHLNGSVSQSADPKPHVNGSANGTAISKEAVGENSAAAEPADAASTDSAPPVRPIEPLKRQKSVRFSPTVESTTFLHSDPPSPNHGASRAAVSATTDVVEDIPNKEHLQLAPEEAFFLAYGVGALRVVDEGGRTLSTKEMLAVCRESRVATSSSSTLFSSTASATDDFLLHYSVYHHFRSLGWVPRHGIKFGVDWMLYGKGPALDHAEFGVMVVPSTGPMPSWHWLHSVNRVLSTVFKSLVLVYVDVPPHTGEIDDISSLLSQYRIREVMVRRWSSNRNRD